MTDRDDILTLLRHAGGGTSTEIAVAWTRERRLPATAALAARRVHAVSRLTAKPSAWVHHRLTALEQAGRVRRTGIRRGGAEIWEATE